MSRRGRSRRPRPRATRTPELGDNLAMPEWVDVWGRRMFVVDFTPAGFPIGVFEDEMDRDWTDDPDTLASDGF